MLRRLSLEDGTVTDHRYQVAAMGWFITAAGNSYRVGSDFERPGGWGDDSDLAERSAALYDLIRANNARLINLID